jgi:hypothetical protein
MEDKYMEDVGAIADYDSRRTEIGHIKAWNEAAEAPPHWLKVGRREILGWLWVKSPRKS